MFIIKELSVCLWRFIVLFTPNIIYKLSPLLGVPMPPWKVSFFTPDNNQPHSWVRDTYLYAQMGPFWGKTHSQLWMNTCLAVSSVYEGRAYGNRAAEGDNSESIAKWGSTVGLSLLCQQKIDKKYISNLHVLDFLIKAFHSSCVDGSQGKAPYKTTSKSKAFVWWN